MTVMAEFVLSIGAFMALLIFVMLLLMYELNMSLVLAGILGVSVISIGFMVALALQLFVGLSMLHTTLGLGALMFLSGMTYDALS